MFCLMVDDDIKLCLLEERHAEQLFALVDRNRIYLRQWLPWPDANTSAADSRAFIKTSLEQFANNNGFQCGIFHHGQLVGLIGYNGIDWTNRFTEIGYWLAADVQGQGIMTKACRFLVNYAFKELGLNRVEIFCAAENRKSCAIPERLGFKNEGVIRQAEWLYDHFVDSVIYGMLASEW
jgi:ribosomal-protein-serine acetyltransferase